MRASGARHEQPLLIGRQQGDHKVRCRSCGPRKWALQGPSATSAVHPAPDLPALACAFVAVLHWPCPVADRADHWLISSAQMGLQRLSSNGPIPNMSGIAQGHRGALVALGAVGLSLGAAWAWKSTKETRLLIKAAPGDEVCGVLPAQKSSGRRRNKRHKARSTEPALQESANSEATGQPFQAPVLSRGPALSDTASTDDPLTEAEIASTLDVTDDTSFAAASLQTFGGLAPNATVALSGPVALPVVATIGQATSPVSPAAEANESDWNVVERRRPRRNRAPPSTEALAGFVDAAGSATEAGEDRPGDASGKPADAEPEPAPLCSSELPAPDEAVELAAEPAAAGPAPGLPSPTAEAQKKKKKKQKRKKSPGEELDSPSDESHCGSVPTWAGRGVPSSVAEDGAALPRPLSEEPGLAGEADGQLSSADAISSTAEAIAAVARFEAAADADAGTAGGEGAWATVTRRRPRRLAAGEERSSGGRMDMFEIPEASCP